METPSQYLYTVHATRLEMLSEGPTSEETAIVDEHFSYLKDLAEKGTVLLVGRTQNNDETTFGLVIFQAGSEEEARAIMNGDPAVAHGIMHGRLYPYRIALKGSRL
ncbi:MAG TPA: YciI family protein [Thermoanaerobaculia bacterium]|nr:YciI family protein [Thermoanaerobaculia bacterium]